MLRLPNRRSASASPMVAVVFPSPCGVNVIALTRINCPSVRLSATACLPLTEVI